MEMSIAIATRRWVLPFIAVVLAGQAGMSPTRAAQDASPGSTRDRAAFMRRHFASVLSLHEAATRGDLAEARWIAREIAARPGPAGIAETLQPYVAVMRVQAERVSADSTQEDVAASIAAMLAACGDCHRAAGVSPAVSSPADPGVGGVVGHMLTHQRALDLMVQGLTVPSTSAWNEGTDMLTAAPLSGKSLPRDPKLTKDIRAAEVRVHELARRSRSAEDTRSRIYVYSELLQSCASCHSLHHVTWGPRH
jgi:hypothetical protein